MSIQPSPIYNKKSNLRLWHELLKLAEILLTEFRLESQFDIFVTLLEQDSTIKAGVWLESSYSTIIDKETLQNAAFLLTTLSPLMETAIHEKRILPCPAYDSNEVNDPLLIVVPMIVKEDLLGIIQLEKLNRDGFTLQDIGYISCLTSQLSLAIKYIQQKSHSEFLQQYISRMTLIEEISKSILSNLDRDSLLNSILSLLHQNLGLHRVNIYTVRDDEKNTLNQIGISVNGIEPETIYDFEHDTGPVHWSLLHLEPVIINDTGLDFRFPSLNFTGNIRSELVLPLFCGDLHIGVLELCGNSEDVFGPDTINGFLTLAQNIAVAVRNANLFHSEQIGRLINEHFQKVIGKVTPQLTLDDIFQKLFDEQKQILPSDAAAIWLINKTDNDNGNDHSNTSLSLVAARIEDQNYLNADQTHPIDKYELFDKYIQNSEDANDLLVAYPWILEVINSDTPVIRNSTSTYEPLGALLGFSHEYSAIGIPLIVNEEHLGIIILVHHETSQFSVESQSIAKTFAYYAAITIENTKLYLAAHDQAWVSTVLLQVAEAAQSITNIEDLLETVVNMLPGLLGVSACTIFLYNQSSDTFFPQASYGFDTDQIDRFSSWEIHSRSVFAFDRLKDSNDPVILNADTLSEETALQVFPNYDFHNDLMVLFPLYTQNGLSGAILIDFTDSTLEIGSSQDVWDEKYTIIQGVAHQTAIGIENLQLIKAQEEEAYISVALLQVAQAIVSLNDLKDILGSIVRITPILVGVKRCIIYLWDKKDQVFRQSEYYGFSKNDLYIMGQVIKANEFPFIEAIQQFNQIIYHTLSPSDSPLAWNVIASGEYQIIDDTTSVSPEALSIKLDIKSLINREQLLIGFPLSIKSEILGVMLIEEEEFIKGTPSLHIREKRIEIVKGITQQAAIAIKNELLQQEALNSERMERELQLAREIQSAFLPDRLPVVTGWDIDVAWQPARQVGGDFYDIFILDDERIGFVIADVADKGMPAALFMTLIRTLIRAAAKDKRSPAAVLKQVNELLVPDSKHSMFVTVFYGIFSLNSGRVIYANAGHNSPIVKQSESGAFIELTRTTMALGIFEDIVVEEQELLLNRGDWMLLYTDGITEAFSAKEEMFGTERLFNLLLDYRFISSTELIKMIERALEDFITGTDLSDDMTIAVISRKNL